MAPDLAPEPANAFRIGRHNEPHPVVADCAAMRAQAVLAPYTISAAICDARMMRATPDAVLDTSSARRIIEVLLAALESNSCYLKAVQQGQGVFVLRDHDRAAPDVIDLWAKIAAAHGASSEKVSSAHQMARGWREQPSELTRWPT